MKKYTPPSSAVAVDPFFEDKLKSDIEKFQKNKEFLSILL
jgi:hypothetical protein